MTYDEIVIDNSAENGEGHSGLVRFGIHRSTNTNVAIKYLTKDSRDAIDRFKQENKILFELIEHKNVIIPFSEVFSSDNGLNLPCYIMEKADEGLLDWLEKYPYDEDLPDKIAMLIAICKAVISIQEQGYIHRDLHEENILVMHEDEKVIPKIMDFGRSYKKHGTFDGSDENAPSWGYYLMPPEIEFGLISHDDPSHMLGDAYAIGLLIKTVLSYDAPTNLGSLRDMKDKIKRFKKMKNDGNSRNYIENRGLDDRKKDYDEWCNSHEEWSKRWQRVELSSQEQSEKLTKLVRDFSNINYKLRESNLNVVIGTLEGL